MASDEINNCSLDLSNDVNEIKARFESFDIDNDGGLASTELKRRKTL